MTSKNNVGLREIYALISMQPNVKYRAYLTLMLSTGLQKKQILNLRVSDFLNAYTDNSIYNGDNLFNEIRYGYYRNVIPMWNIDFENKERVVFSSTESTFYIQLSLAARAKKEDIVYNSKLFDIPDSSVTEIFNRNKRLDNDFKITGDSLRNFYEDACILGIPDIDDSSRKYSYKKKGKYSTTKNKLIKLFTEGLKESNEVKYNKFKLMRCYQDNIMPRVTAKNYDCLYETMDDYLKKDKISLKIENMDEKELLKEFMTNSKVYDENSNIDIYKSMQEDNIKRSLILEKLPKEEKYNYSDEEICEIIDNYINYCHPKLNEYDLSPFKEYACKSLYFKDSSDFLHGLLIEWYIETEVDSLLKEDRKIDLSNYETVMEEIILDLTPFLKKYDIEEDYRKYLLKWINTLQGRADSVDLTLDVAIDMIFDLLYKKHGIQTFRHPHLTG